MLTNIFIFAAALYLVAFVAVNSSIKGIPSFGLGVLFGTSVADLTLIFAIIVLHAGRSLKVESTILKNQVAYPFLLLLPLILGLDGHFSRLEGAALVVAGAVFYYVALKRGIDRRPSLGNGNGYYASFLLLLVSMGVLLTGAHFTVASATALARSAGVSPILIGMLVVALGMTMPELLFSLQSVKKRDDSLAIGDLLGTVLADATIVVGILALVNPFSFPQKIIYITGSFMVAASFVLFRFMRSGRALAKREAFALLMFWLVFVAVEFIANGYSVY
ncbi:MAG: hypothetical protein HYS76_00510 [Candidatus Wildermuthbacteria bacterium]|nr:hypothetical protein [Candidatus Wildermuthbacteria bacterium]